MFLLILIDKLGTRIGRVKVVFRLPETVRQYRQSGETMEAPQQWGQDGPLAYVEWFSKLSDQANEVHMMYEVRKMPVRVDGCVPGEIMPLSMIRQSCQLIPYFPRPKSADEAGFVPEDWTSDTVMDKATRFLLNNWATKYAYQTLW